MNLLNEVSPADSGGPQDAVNVLDSPGCRVGNGGASDPLWAVAHGTHDSDSILCEGGSSTGTGGKSALCMTIGGEEPFTLNLKHSQDMGIDPAIRSPNPLHKELMNVILAAVPEREKLVQVS